MGDDSDFFKQEQRMGEALPAIRSRAASGMTNNTNKSARVQKMSKRNTTMRHVGEFHMIFEKAPVTFVFYEGPSRRGYFTVGGNDAIAKRAVTDHRLRAEAESWWARRDAASLASMHAHPPR